MENEPIGFLSLSEKERLSYINANYPEVEEEGLMMLRLYRQGAVSSENGIEIWRIPTGFVITDDSCWNRHLPTTKVLDELIDAEQVKKVKGKIFLTELGKRVTEGMLKIYPELS